MDRFATPTWHLSLDVDVVYRFTGLDNPVGEHAVFARNDWCQFLEGLADHALLVEAEVGGHRGIDLDEADLVTFDAENQRGCGDEGIERRLGRLRSWTSSSTSCSRVFLRSMVMHSPDRAHRLRSPPPEFYRTSAV